ncbi:MAG: diguanylate cyclase [Clostridiales bacterium]|nr:diguanylate cyclase [Clostridiales bacterium]
MLDIFQNTLESTEYIPSTNEWNLSIQDTPVNICYLDAQHFPQLESTPELKTIYHRLTEGEEVIIEPGNTLLSNDASQFAILRPIFSDSDLTGVLYVRLDTALLTSETTHSDSFFQKIYIILVKPDGSIIYANTPYPNKNNMFSATLQGGINSDEVEDIQRVFEKNESMTLSFSGKGNSYYMSWESLDFIDWRVVMFARSPDIVFQTTTILKVMITTGIFLIVITAAFCVALIYLLLRQKRHLEAQQRRYDALAQFNDTLLFEYDVLSDCLMFTPNALERLDLDDQCLEGKPLEYYLNHLVHADDLESFQKKFQLSDILLSETYSIEARFRCKDGAYNWFGCQFKSIENRGENTSRIVGKLVDINDQRGREQFLRQAAQRDALTGVYNRAAETIINSLLSEKPQGLLFLLDLDDFKSINDTYGHAVGDALLIGIAQVLQEVFRPEDIIARMGGDEFVVFLSGTSDPSVAEKKASAIQNRLERLSIPGVDHSISASIGASSAPKDGSTYDMLSRAADQEMYTIKQQSKKGFSFRKQID